MTNIQAIILNVEAAAFLVAVILTIWSLGDAVAAKRKAKLGPRVYEDKDGSATVETQANYSLFWPNVALGMTVVGGLAVAITEGTLASRHQLSSRSSWADTGVWTVEVIQFLVILRERRPGLAATFALRQTSVFLAILFSRSIYLLDSIFGYSATASSAAREITKLEYTKAALSTFGFLATMLYPNRPEIFYKGRALDQQFTVSAWSRYNYNWAGDVLLQNRKILKKTLQDFRELDHLLRASDMYQAWLDLRKTSHFLISIHLAHFWAIVWNWIYQFLSSIAELAAPYAMFELLKVLQRRDAGQDVTQIGIVWVLALGFSQLVGAFTNGRMWYGEGYVHIPLRLEIPALVFTKALRKKDVRTSSKKVAVQKDTEDDSSKKEDPEDEEEDETKKTRQAVVNLVGVDAQRVANYMGIGSWIFGALLKLGIAIYLLQAIVGWIPLVVGIATMGLTMPLNVYFTKVYLNAQDGLMKARDNKLEVVNEVLGGIRQIKFSALEEKWEKKIMASRGAELDVLWTAFKADIILVGVWLSSPVLINGGCLITYVITQGSLTPSIAFTSITLLNKLGNALAMLPEISTMAVDCWVSAKRIGKYLNAPDKAGVATPGDQISFKDATISWPTDDLEEDTFKLYNLNMAFPLGKLSVISGRTGSGKSLLLSAILGEIELLSGKITVPLAPQHDERNDKGAHGGNWILPNAVAFVPQTPWIENCSFRENVLFGLPYNKERYDQVIQACALEKDLEILIDGDSTEIGPKGINLSGGQCWRLTLARALYSRAGILLLDDIFSAVDAHVARHIYDIALTGPISVGRTRILVTHHVALCRPKTEYEVRLENGTVGYAGPVDELAKAQQLIPIDENEVVLEIDDDVNIALDEVERRMSSTVARKLSRSSSHTNRRTSRRDSQRPVVANGTTGQTDNQPKKFVEEEDRESGHVSFAVYAHYLKACGGFWFWTITVALFVIFQYLGIQRTWILRLWSREPEIHPALSSAWAHSFGTYLPKNITISVQVEDEDRRNAYYASLFVLISIIMCIEGTLRYIYVFNGSIKASRSMFEGLTHAVLRAPLRWLDTMPVGRILNRFTADFNNIDTSQAYGMSFGFWNLLTVVGIGIAGAVVSLYLLLITFILLGLSAYYASFYLDGARDTKRLESVAKSPVFEQLTTALQGVTSIRAYQKMETYYESMFAKIDAHGRCLWHLNIYKRWLGWRLAIIGTAFSTIVAFFIVGYKGMDAALAGFALSFALSYSDAVFFMLRQYVEVELGMNSTERIIEYSSIEIESQDGDDVPASWPSKGGLEVENLVVAYAKNLPPVLKGLNFEVKAKERIGVVGRTGAGKSSLTLALFRFLEAREGTIYIDGIDTSKIKLHDLRSRLAIIPQDPVLFSGTMRSNLDPFDERGDSELFEALRRVHLIEDDDEQAAESSNSPSASGTATPQQKNTNVFKDLSSQVAESGSNLSQGQRQLLCLARAIVSRPKIMFLDEATSAVDKITDTLIQRSIREEFEDATLLVIAHRLSTIADFDRILVLDDGKVVEYDTPKNLWDLGPDNGVFRAMVESSGERDVLRDIILGTGENQKL